MPTTAPHPEEFASPGWFQRLPVPTTAPDRPCFTVEHRTARPNGETLIHQQFFNDNALVAWTPQQPAPAPDLTLTRPLDCDGGDLLGRLTATHTILHTRITTKTGHTTCPLGITNTPRPGLNHHAAPQPADILLEVPDTPFGDAHIAIRLNPDGTQHLTDPAHADTDTTILIAWTHLIDWLHTHTRLGHLYAQHHARIQGDIIKLSYTEGHLTWPPAPHHQHHTNSYLQTIRTYHQLRTNPDYLDLMDHIEQTTAP